MLMSLQQMWQFRTLVGALVRRHIATRYRGSVFGFLWSLLNPLCLMAVYTLVFSYYMRVQGGPHYALMVFAGLLPWIWTSSALLEGTASLVNSGHLITKSLFPPQVLPVVSVTAAMVHFLLALPVLAVFALCGGVSVSWTWLFLPVVVLLHAVFLTGMVLALSALNVFYRDVQHLVGNLLTLLFFLCPVVYPVSVVPEKFRFLVTYNPFAALTQFYQELLVQGVFPQVSSLVYVGCICVAVGLIGLRVHGHYQERFAEAL
jgi:ABC-type polysaccharide/polyol phosphate export permease